MCFVHDRDNITSLPDSLVSGDVLHLEPLDRRHDVSHHHMIGWGLVGEVVENIMAKFGRQETWHVLAVMRILARLASHHRDPAFGVSWHVCRQIQALQLPRKGFSVGGFGCRTNFKHFERGHPKQREFRFEDLIVRACAGTLTNRGLRL